MAYSMAAPYEAAVRSGMGFYFTVDATVGGVAVPGATGLRPVGGQITDTTKPGVRRALSLELDAESGLFDALTPQGTQLAVTCHVTYVDRSTHSMPMGVFDVDSSKVAEGGGSLSLTAPDKWVRIQRAKFLKPQAANKGMLVVDELVGLIRGALGSSEPVSVTATSTAVMTALTWEKDRDKAIMDVAADIGAWVYFDRNGLATIADIPTIGTDADWLVDASANGVLLELDREKSRANTSNIVVVESSHSGGSKFATQYVWDNDPGSPTYAGPGLGGSPTPPTPGSAGPFGQVPFFHDTPILTAASAALATGRTILARVSGLASQLSLTSAPNPAMDAFDVIDVLPPPERYGVPRAMERHVADTVTHPLSVSRPTQVAGRSTRSEELP